LLPARTRGPDVLPAWPVARYNACEMPFTVKDFQSLLRLLERQPQWKDALRASLLGEEFLELPSLVRNLVQAQRATQRELRALAEAHRLTQQEVRALAEQVRTLADAQARTQQELQAVAEQVRALTDIQARTQQELQMLAEAQARTQQELQTLAGAQARTQQELQALAEAQARTQRELQALAGAQARTQEELQALAEAQARTQQELRAVAEQVRTLADAQARMQEELRALAEAQARTQQDLQALANAQMRTEQVVRELVQTVSALKGENLERRYRERAASYFQRILRRIRVLDHQQLGLLLDDALDQGRITPEERAQVLEADVVVTGLVDGREVYLLAEVSGTVTAHDVRRARARSAILEKATGAPVLPAVAGEQLSDDHETQEEAPTVWRVLDGRALPPSQVGSS